MTTLEEAREFFSNDKFATQVTGIVIDDVGEKYAKCSLKLEPCHRNAVGGVMGGVIFTLADFVFAVASNFNQPMTVTTSSHISYIGSVRGEILYGESKLLRDGKRTCFYEITVTDETGNLVAVVSANGSHIIK